MNYKVGEILEAWEEGNPTNVECYIVRIDDPTTRCTILEMLRVGKEEWEQNPYPDSKDFGLGWLRDGFEVISHGIMK